MAFQERQPTLLTIDQTTFARYLGTFQIQTNYLTVQISQLMDSN